MYALFHAFHIPSRLPKQVCESTCISAGYVAQRLAIGIASHRSIVMTAADGVDRFTIHDHNVGASVIPATALTNDY